MIEANDTGGRRAPSEREPRAWTRRARVLVGLLVPLALPLAFGCASFNPFQADVGAMAVDGALVRPSYLSTRAYVGFYAGADDSPYVYLWLPTATPELGVRASAPASSRLGGSLPDVLTEPAATAHLAEGGSLPLQLEVARCAALFDLSAPLGRHALCPEWVVLDTEGRRAAEAAGAASPREPSVLRVASNEEDPLRVLGRGLYRVRLVAPTDGHAVGTFQLEVGAPLSLAGSAMARSESALAATVSGRGAMPLVVQPDRDGFVALPGRPAFAPPVPDSLAPARRRPAAPPAPSP